MPGVCPRCLREVYFAEEKLALGKVWHTFCFSCRNCRKLLDSCTVATHCGELFCRNCCTRLFAPSVQPPSPPPTSVLTVDHRGPPFPSARAPASACDSVSDCYCCCCCPDQEDFTVADQVQSDPRGNRLEKERLRGGGGEEEESEEFRICPETRHCSDSECSNLGVVSSVTTLCNVPSSPTAVTTWYNRQHSASQSTFGGQTCTQKHLSRPTGAPSPRKVATDFRSNNRDCGLNCVKGGSHKCTVVRRSGSPYHAVGQQNQQQLQQQQQLPQLQQQEIPSRPTQQQQQSKKQQQESRQEQIQSGSFNRTNNNNHHQPPLRYVPTRQEVKIELHETENRIGANINSLRGRPATPSPPPKFYHHQYPRRRVSFCSDIPSEEAIIDYSTSELSSFRMKMPNENSNNNHGNVTSGNCPMTLSNNCNYTSSNGTAYETCYEMDDSNPTGYFPSNGPQIYNCSPPSLEDGSSHPLTSDHEGESRLRGGCGGCGSGGGGGCGSGGGGGGGRGGGCGCGGSGCGGSGGCGGCPVPMQCPPRDECREIQPACGAPICDPPCGGRGGCCPPAGCRPVCRKPGRSCCPPCTAEPQGCGGGGCCGGGCRGGCGKPGRICMPLRPCSAPPCQPQVCRPRGSPCMPPRSCAPIPPCCKTPGVTSRPGCSGGVGGGSCCRSRSPRRGCCSSAPQDDGGCGYCGPRLPPGCECLGGGLDCQRCGRKVYQAEMQIASGVPYHNICFSCFCCRKLLEPLTYQENCGEIYCKQCYVRNFGPQGYGYGAGAGVLQTPM